MISRRSLLSGLSVAPFVAGAEESTGVARYRTSYKLGRLVLSASPDQQAFDSRSVDCPFVFRYEKQFYMTYIGFDGIGYQTGLASSPDLLTWKREGCIIRRNPASAITRYNVGMNWILRENGLHSSGRLRRVHGRFLGVYHAYPNAGLEEGPAVIGLCWSRDLQNWSLDDPCLRPKDGAAWERGGLYKPCLVEHEGTFYIFYNAKTEEKRWHEQTGVATSRDLTTWTRYENNPVIRNGAEHSWDQRFASDPCVLTDGNKWILYYFGLSEDGKARDLIATGRDPFHFDKIPEIGIDVGPPGSVDSTYAHKPSVIFHHGSLYHFYCAVSGAWPNEVRGISVARSREW